MLFAAEYSVDVAEVMRARVFGGIMSRRAVRRSRRDSSGWVVVERSSSEISESREGELGLGGCNMGGIEGVGGTGWTS